jgi:hypothetical protein
MKSDDKSSSTEAAASKRTSTNDDPLDEISSSISEMVSQFVDEMLNTPLYADPFSSATENMLDKNGWKLALTPSYIQEGAVRSDPPSPLKRLLSKMPPKDEC